MREYTRIKNCVLRLLSRTHFASNSRRVLDVIIRYAWGYRSPTAQLSLKKFVEYTHLNKTHICRGIKDLVDRKIIFVEKKDKKNKFAKNMEYEKLYTINENFLEWK